MSAARNWVRREVRWDGAGVRLKSAEPLRRCRVRFPLAGSNRDRQGVTGGRSLAKSSIACIVRAVGGLGGCPAGGIAGIRSPCCADRAVVRRDDRVAARRENRLPLSNDSLENAIIVGDFNRDPNRPAAESLSWG